MWVIDPATNQRVSTIAIVKTDPTRVEDTDSQSGVVPVGDSDFNKSPPDNGGGGGGGGRGRNPPTHDPLDDSSAN